MSALMALAGAAILIGAGDLLVRGAVAMSLRLGLSLTLISLTVVALGTSAPELVICVQAALDGAPDIAVGNVVGSNVANILLVIGVAALICPLRDDTQSTLRNYLLMIGASVLLIAIGALGHIGRALGVMMILLLIAILWQAYRRGRADDVIDPEALDGADELSPAKTSVMLLLGLAGLPIGAHLLIEGARDLALQFGISEAAIGLTLVALGTSLPELAATGMAALRGRTEMALGNAIGSNLFNILGILGATAVVQPVSISESFQTLGIPVMALSSLVLLPFLWYGHRIGRFTGAVMTAAYCAFAAYLVAV